MRVAPEVEIAFTLAQREAARRRHEFISVEHLLYALLFDDETKNVVLHAGGDPDKIRKKLDQFLDKEVEKLDADTTPTPSLGFQRVVQRAAVHVQHSGKEELKGKNLLIAMFQERESDAVALLHAAGVDRLAVLQYVSHGISKIDGEGEGEGEHLSAEEGDEDDEAGAKKVKDPLAEFTINLNEKAAEDRSRERGVRFASSLDRESARDQGEERGERGHRDRTHAETGGLPNRLGRREPFVATQLLGVVGHEH